MAFINEEKKEINLKILYFGPPCSGKSTSLRAIYNRVKDKSEGELISLASEGESLLYFDFLPLRLGKYKKYQIRLHLYAVPGESTYPVARKIIAKGLDGVVFTADSTPERLEANKNSLEELKALLKDESEDFAKLPLVIQYNKRDLSKATSVENLRQYLNPRKVPDFETVAKDGTGVFEALQNIGKQVLKSLNGS